MEVYINDKPVELDREMIKISDLLGYVGIKRIPGMSISVNGSPIRQTQWIKFPIFDGDKLNISSSEEITIKVRR
jgi:Sulfur transfer protein involved in thiamine biosynthesis